MLEILFLVIFLVAAAVLLSSVFFGFLGMTSQIMLLLAVIISAGASYAIAEYKLQEQKEVPGAKSSPARPRYRAEDSEGGNTGVAKRWWR